MQQKCANAIAAAAKSMGRAVTASQLAEIESRIIAEKTRLARIDPDWGKKSDAQRTLEAATSAMKAIQAEASLKVTRAHLQILATSATEDRIKSQQKLYKKSSRTDGLAHDMVNVDNAAAALSKTTFGRLMDLIDAAKDATGTSIGRRVSMFLFDSDNPAMTLDIAREIYRGADGSTGNKIAQAGAKSWLKVIEDLRQRFNAAGGDVGKLDYGYAPITHDAGKVAKAGRDAWVAKVLPLMDRRRYVDENGTRLDDVAMTGLLNSAWETISSEGMNKQTPGSFKGPGARANRGSEARVLHFKGGDEYVNYMQQFGRGDMFSLMAGHVRGMARDITHVENYGPNPNAQMRLQFDLAAREDGKLGRVGFGVGIVRVNPEGMWRTMSGTASTPGSEAGAQFFQHVRNIQGLKLAGTFLKMFPDLGTYFVTTGYGKLGYWNAIANLGRSATKEGREFAAMHGLIADAGLKELQRFTGETLGSQWSARLSNSQMKLTLGDAWTTWLDRAAGLTKMNAMGKLAGVDWSKLTQWDRLHLERAGLTAEDWAVVRQAKPSEFHGASMLSPEDIMATGHDRAAQVADKVLAAIRNEIDMSVIKPDLLNRTAGTWNGLQAGTGAGEFARSVMQFKSFPMAMITRHWARMMDAPKVTDGSAPWLANRTVYAGALGLSLTGLGAISMQATSIARGKDPIDMFGPHAAKFWLNAFSTGGAGGFYSDLITRDSTQDRSSNDLIGGLAGPSAGDLSSLYQLTKGSADDRLAGKTTHAAAEGIRFARGHLPYVNMWYARSALDHAGLAALQENVSPGYLGKMQQQAQKDWGEKYWWAPGSNGPQRAPDFAKSVGQ